MFNLWEQLKAVTLYEYESAPGPHSATGWRGGGIGTVTVQDGPDSNVLCFAERGTFTLADSGQSVDTQNEFVWQWLNERRVRLSHSRHGRAKMVELFELVYDDASNEWISETAHVCGDDLYSGKAAWKDGVLHFFWNISGPHKQESLHYRYTRPF